MIGFKKRLLNIFLEPRHALKIANSYTSATQCQAPRQVVGVIYITFLDA